MNPHDALFKAVFGQPEHAHGALRALMPVAVAESLDWSTLTLCPGSFVDESLREQHTDLLYSVKRRADRADTLVYFLFEHQSTQSTELMGYRLLRYKVGIWGRWRDEHRDAKRLPVIFPIVLYHGSTEWHDSPAFEDLFDVEPELRTALDPYLIRFSYVLYDLSKISDDELRVGATQTALAKLAALCFKHARDRTDLYALLERWVDVMRDVVGAKRGLDALALVMQYILIVNDQTTRAGLKTFLEHRVPEAKEAIVTAGEQLIEEGRQQGIQQGIQQGQQQALRKSLLTLLRQRFGTDVGTDVEGRVAAASLQ